MSLPTRCRATASTGATGRLEPTPSAAATGSPRLTRVRNLLGVTPAQGNAQFGARLNGDTFLNATTVHDDGVRDTETSNAGRDWFFANTDGDHTATDRVKDAAS